MLNYYITVFKFIHGETWKKQNVSVTTKALKWGVSFVLTTSYFTVASFCLQHGETHVAGNLNSTTEQCQ